MAAYAGAVVAYQTNNGPVIAVTTAHRDSNGDKIDDTAGNAAAADLVVLGWNNTKLQNVTKDGSAGTLGATITVGQWAVIA